MVDFINSWRQGNKKDTKIDVSIRLGRISLLEIYLDFGCEYRLMLFNFGVSW